jgi:HlyD family secretion protein
VASPLKKNPPLQLDTEVAPRTEPGLAMLARATTGGGQGLWKRLGLLAILGIVAYLVAQRLLGPEVPVHEVVRRDIVQTVVASGQVQSPNRIEISSQISGNVIEIPVEEGQFVEAGEVLIQLDKAEAQSAVAVAQGALEQAQARLAQLREVQLPQAQQALEQARANQRNALASSERAESLRRSGVVTQVVLDEARRARDVADAQVRSSLVLVTSLSPGGTDYVGAETQIAQAEASLRMATARLGFSTIRAPAEGTLISRNVERGWVVQPGRTLMTLSPVGETQLVVLIDERNLGLVATGQPALAAADAFPKEIFAARLVYINPGVDPQRGAVQVKLAVPDPPPYLRQDMTVSVDIEVARRADAIVLPSEAVRDASGTRPWVMKAIDGRAQLQPVEIGIRGAGRIEITSGLEPGDLVIPPATGIAVGQRLRPRVPHRLTETMSAR